MNTFSQRSKCRHSLYSAKGEGRGSEAGPSPVAPPPPLVFIDVYAPPPLGKCKNTLTLLQIHKYYIHI